MAAKRRSTETNTTASDLMESKLSEFFTPCRMPPAAYTDPELQRVSELLKNMGRPAWASIPRIYTVLRTIGQLEHLDVFFQQGITDIWFPFSTDSLPGQLSPSMSRKFLDCQSIVLTKWVNLEKGLDLRHAHFGEDETLPFEVVCSLGKGGFGSVDKVISLLSYREFARKKFRRKGLRSRADVASFKTELMVLKRLRHRHCVELVGSYTDSKSFGLIMSPVADCNLLEFYAFATQSPDQMSLLRGFFGCLANAILYLHESKIRHRDIKPTNILVKGNTVYVTDFGISHDFGTLTKSTTTADSAKTMLYAAPEVAGVRPRNTKADLWSLGCVFLEMVTVMKGAKLRDLREFFFERTENRCFWANDQAIAEWTAVLRQMGSGEDNVLLEWITDMLKVDAQLRPTAKTLFDTISSYEPQFDELVSFCGPCCREEQTTESSDDSADEAWGQEETTAKTSRPTTQSTTQSSNSKSPSSYQQWHEDPRTQDVIGEEVSATVQKLAETKTPQSAASISVTNPWAQHLPKTTPSESGSVEPPGDSPGYGPTPLPARVEQWITTPSTDSAADSSSTFDDVFGPLDANSLNPGHQVNPEQLAPAPPTVIHPPQDAYQPRPHNPWHAHLPQQPENIFPPYQYPTASPPAPWPPYRPLEEIAYHPQGGVAQFQHHAPAPNQYAMPTPNPYLGAYPGAYPGTAPYQQFPPPVPYSWQTPMLAELPPNHGLLPGITSNQYYTPSELGGWAVPLPTELPNESPIHEMPAEVPPIVLNKFYQEYPHLSESADFILNPGRSWNVIPPTLSPVHWTSPDILLHAVKSNKRFMNELQRTYPTDFEFIAGGITKDLPKILRCMFSSGFIVPNELTEYDLKVGVEYPLVLTAAYQPPGLSAEITEMLLMHGARTNVATRDGNTPLMSAAKRGNYASAAMLLRTGAQTSPIDKYGETALDKALSGGFQSIASILLEFGALPGPNSPSIPPHLITPSIQGYLTAEYIRRFPPAPAASAPPPLIPAEIPETPPAPSNTPTTTTTTAMFPPAELPTRKPSRKEQVDKPPAPAPASKTQPTKPITFEHVPTFYLPPMPLLTARDWTGPSYFLEAVISYRILMDVIKAADLPLCDSLTSVHPSEVEPEMLAAVARILMKEGLNVNLLLRDSHAGPTPLQYVLEWGSEYSEMFNLMVRHGAIINQQGADGSTVLTLACSKGNLWAIRYLIDSGIKVDEQTGPHMMNPILYAAKFGQLGAVTLLISKGSNIEVRNSDRQSPLLLAAKFGHSSVVRVLLDRGADILVRSSPHLPTDDLPNCAVLTHAAVSGSLEAVSLLIDAGANLEDASGEDGNTVLCTTAGLGLTDMANFLISRGADVNARGISRGLTPLSAAASAGHVEMVKLLLSHGADVDSKGLGIFTATAQVLAKNNGHKEVVAVLREAKKMKAKGKGLGWFNR